MIAQTTVNAPMYIYEWNENAHEATLRPITIYYLFAGFGRTADETDFLLIRIFRRFPPRSGCQKFKFLG